MLGMCVGLFMDERNAGQWKGMGECVEILGFASSELIRL